MIDIRPTIQEDLPRLAEIYVDAYNTLKIGENWDNDSAFKLLKHFHNDQPDLFFTAEENGKLLGGIVSTVKPWWNGNNLTDGELFVDPASQGKGVGTKLIQQMFTVALEKYQAKSWDTFTHRVHEFPLNWYKKLGFEEIQQWVMITGDIKKVLNNISSG